MKKIIPFILAAASLLTLPSCRFIYVSDELNEQLSEEGFNWMGEDTRVKITASDNYITRTETTGEFHSLTSNLPADIIYTPGDCAISINAPDNVLDNLTVLNENGTLEIKSNMKQIRNLKKITVNVSSPVLESASFSGTVDFRAPDGITALNFDATVNGAGDININGLKANSVKMTVNGAGDANVKGLDCDALTVSINGAGDAVLAGRSGSASLTISGAGDIDARQLDCEDVQSSIRGLGSIKRNK